MSSKAFTLVSIAFCGVASSSSPVNSSITGVLIGVSFAFNSGYLTKNSSCGNVAVSRANWASFLVLNTPISFP